jgi:hypothetical protein
MSDPKNSASEASASAGPDLSAISFGVFIKCRKCGTLNCFDVPPRRVDLVRFRGLENPIKCKGCHVDIDSMLAYCGEGSAQKWCAAKIHDTDNSWSFNQDPIRGARSLS